MDINLEKVMAEAEKVMTEAICQQCASSKGCAYDRMEGSEQCILLAGAGIVPTTIDPEDDGVAPDDGDHEYNTPDPKSYLDNLAADITILGASYSVAHNADPLMAVKCQMAVEKIIELERLIDEINL